MNDQMYTDSGSLRTSLEFNFCQLILRVQRFYNMGIKCVCTCTCVCMHIPKELEYTYTSATWSWKYSWTPSKKSCLPNTRLVERTYSPWNLFGFVEDPLLHPDPHFMTEGLSPSFREVCQLKAPGNSLLREVSVAEKSCLNQAYSISLDSNTWSMGGSQGLEAQLLVITQDNCKGTIWGPERLT